MQTINGIPAQKYTTLKTVYFTRNDGKLSMRSPANDRELKEFIKEYSNGWNSFDIFKEKFNTVTDEEIESIKIDFSQL